MSDESASTTAGSTAAAARELLTEKVLRAAEQIPAGRVASYGDLAAIVGTGPRQVGQVMARDGSTVCWWRVTNAAGELPPRILSEALPRWRQEGIALRPNGRGCRIDAHRCDLLELAAAWQAATADLA